MRAFAGLAYLVFAATLVPVGGAGVASGHVSLRRAATSPEAAANGTAPGPAGHDAAVPDTVSGATGNHGADRVHDLAHRLLMPVWLVFGAAVLVATILASYPYTRVIPESAVVICVALILGLFARWSLAEGWMDHQTFKLVNSVLLNLFLLPVIIFTGGWALSRSDFLSQFEYILVFATGGTVISTFVIGGLAYWLDASFMHYGLTLREALVFAALISAVDPVATLAAYGKLGIQRKQPLLNTLVFGESVINDAVAIVIFDVLNFSTLSEVQVSAAVLEILRLLFVSLGLGVALAILLVLLMRLAKPSEHAVPVTIYIFICAYIIFTVAESLHLSGIIAALFGGIVFRLYGAPQLSQEGQHTTGEFLETVAHLADTAVFLLCGTSTALINSGEAWAFGLVGVLLCFVGRAASVGSCSALSNAVKRCVGDPSVITVRHQFMMWHGGLRGGIALVLALEINEHWCHRKGLILDATFIIICALLLLCGSTTELFLRLLGMVGEEGDKGLADAHASIHEKLGGSYGRQAIRASHSILCTALTGKSAEEIDSAHEGRDAEQDLLPGAAPLQA